MPKQYTVSISLKAAGEKVALFARAEKTPDGSNTKNTAVFTTTIESEKKNIDMVRMFQLSKTYNSDGVVRSHYYFGLIPIEHIEAVIETHNSYICEYLTENSYPHRLYFDIDDKKGKITLDEVKRIMKQYFGLSKSEYTISGYVTDSKNSYHVIAKRLTLTCYDDVKRMKTLVKAVNLAEGFDTNIIDPAVYRRAGAMKCVYQSKPQGTVAVPLHPVETSSKFNSQDFYIASFVPKDATPYFSTGKLNTDLSTKLKVNIEALTPTTTLDLPMDFIWSTNDMFKADIATARKLLSLVPFSTKDGDIIDTHSFRRKVACFCFGNGLKEQDFNTWFYKTNPSKHRQEKVSTWWTKDHRDSLSMEYAISIPSFTKYLSQWYPALTVENPNTGYFLNSFDLGIPATTISRIEAEHFNVNERVLIFNIGMGGGKTTTTLQELKRLVKKSFVWLAPRQTLVQNTSGRMEKEFELPHITHLDVGVDKTKLTKAKHLIICNQSLHYLELNQQYDIVIIDEIETVLLSWLDESTHGKNLKDNFKQFCNVIKRASKVILLDAFVTTKTINLLKDLGIQLHDIKLYESAYMPAEKKLIYNKTEDEIVDKIVDAVVKGEKSYIFYPFKKPSKKHMGIIEFDTYIKDKVKEKRLSTAKTAEDKLFIHENPPNSLLYFAESKEKNNLGEINILWADMDYILTTSSITVGVNYENKDYHHVFLLASGATNAPRDVIQSSMRIRYPQNTNINYHLYDVNLRDIEKFPSYFHEDDDIYKNLVIQNLREIQSGFVDAFYKLCGLTNYKLDIEQEEMYRIKQRKNYINTMFETSNLLEYTKVPVVTDEEKIQTIQNKMYTRCADMVDRLTVERYYFDIQFRNLDEAERAHIWNTNRKEFFSGIKNEFIKMVESDNNVSRIVDIDPRKFVVTDATMNYIAKHYSIVKSKKMDSKVIQVINSILGYEAIRIKTDKSKHKLVVVSDATKTLYDYHVKKQIADEQERLNEVKFIEEEKKNSLTKSEWISKWYDAITDDDMIKVETVYDDETFISKYKHPWDTDEHFYLKPVPAKHEYEVITELDPKLYKPLKVQYLPAIKGVNPPPLPIQPRAPQGPKPDTAKTPRPIRVVAPTH